MSYREVFGLSPDFRIAYRILTAAEGGRRTGPPWQGYRGDFAYAEDLDQQKHQAYMIHPEFEGADGRILEDQVQALPEGYARMWILNPAMRPLHQERIYVGTQAYIVEGSRAIAVCTVVEILALMQNPVTQT